ncbi:MAG: hypothetical protein AVDCRST_MAG37-1940 [uncultured Rubrobacteraceae bacterium]|uniref:Uncharacterized protein n=1 Tax=uncultured Rubrobacteraceae bacterium TaxID=349277 RepID=A0A6J4QR78_9ACTN|nr:MAG: hypothetical protein AVDCRST_MAG37-1940 [uncultured Rubrobacteraceae bacterium]
MKSILRRILIAAAPVVFREVKKRYGRGRR